MPLCYMLLLYMKRAWKLGFTKKLGSAEPSFHVRCFFRVYIRVPLFSGRCRCQSLTSCNFAALNDPATMMAGCTTSPMLHVTLFLCISHFLSLCCFLGLFLCRFWWGKGMIRRWWLKERRVTKPQTPPPPRKPLPLPLPLPMPLPLPLPPHNHKKTLSPLLCCVVFCAVL